MRIEEIAERLTRYVERHVFPTMNNLQRVAVRSFLEMVKKRPDAFRKKIADDALLGWVLIETEDGDIDIDPILCALREAVSNEGSIVLDTQMFGKMTFHPSDIEQLIKCFRE